MADPLCRSLFVVFILMPLWLSGCATQTPAPIASREDYGPAPEGYYRILPGDTLSAIAVRQRIDMDKLARWNGLEPPYGIRAGMLLRVKPVGRTRTVDRTEPAIVVVEPKPTRSMRPKSGTRKTAKTSTTKQVDKKPDSKPVARNASGKEGSKTEKKTASAKGGTKAAASGLNWRWPLRGRVVQSFSRRDRTRQGIRISGRAGAKVSAAEAGTVVYSGSGLKGYGNLIIIKHNNDYLSAYGFNRRLLAAEGIRVKRGQSVAEIGRSAGGEYLLHFEIRRDGAAVNPLDYLPASP